MLSQLQRDGPSGSALPSFLTNSSTYSASIPLANQTVQWDALSDGWDGFTLLVDDVERYTGSALNYSLAALQAGIPHFFRLAVSSLVGVVYILANIGNQFTDDNGAGDFTMPATLWPNGTWVDPLPGPS